MTRGQQSLRSARRRTPEGWPDRAIAAGGRPVACRKGGPSPLAGARGRLRALRETPVAPSSSGATTIMRMATQKAAQAQAKHVDGRHLRRSPIAAAMCAMGSASDEACGRTAACGTNGCAVSESWRREPHGRDAACPCTGRRPLRASANRARSHPQPLQGRRGRAATMRPGSPKSAWPHSTSNPTPCSHVCQARLARSGRRRAHHATDVQESAADRPHQDGPQLVATRLAQAPLDGIRKIRVGQSAPPTPGPGLGRGSP